MIRELAQGTPLRNLIRRTRSWYWRSRYRLPHVDPTFLLSWGCHIHPDFVAGALGYMGHGCVIRPRVRAGRYVMFGADVSIVGADHRFDLAGTPMIFSGRPDLPETIIEDDVWLGGRSTLMAGITIGRGSIIAAGSVVTRDVPPYSIMAGVPARLLRKRFDSAEDEHKHDEMLDSADYVAEFAHPKH